ncbi:membrane integrity-associated transporter subunit PqiC [Desulfoglaeba alkanexedens ALDC]|uniref:Membrane integrity-associated transporter subunit PqiC n=1 Tax=Desulfoglaeba alkanexedens ALDC TaxID=980445 RepID=A0A4P8L1H7_9BACT|nr:membrane integrity-associated transporter subunit PqiC [Desulfoglaeba alkanexedens ALDC]
MRQSFWNLRRLTAPMLLLPFLCGCIWAVSPPARHYVLESSQALRAAQSHGAGFGKLVLGVGPVEIPSYLDRPQIVTRPAPAVAELAEFDRWAEPLREALPRVLAENLSMLLGTDNVYLYPWKRSIPIDVQVTAQVIRFEGTCGGEVDLVARWSIRNAKEQQAVVPWNHFEAKESCKGSSAQDYVTALSRLVERLAAEIAHGVEKERQHRSEIPARASQNAFLQTREMHSHATFAASWSASEKVGCPWTARAISSAAAPNSMARTHSAIMSEALGPRMCTPSSRSVLEWLRTFTNPSVSPMQRARPTPVNG